jgi:hypothetical protein
MPSVIVSFRITTSAGFAKKMFVQLCTAAADQQTVAA